MDYRLFPPEEIIETSVRLPLSKSVSARTLIMAYLTPGVVAPPTDRIADCDDTAILRHVLENNLSAKVDVGAAGTAMRFLTALFAALPGRDVVLTGTERMCRRPIGPLVEALRALGANIRYLGEEGFPPMEISGKRLSGGKISIEAGLSSQFISALMMVAPTMENPLSLDLCGDITSLPYIRMTAEMMRRRGVDVQLDRDRLTVPNTPYLRSVDDAEPDWSAASFWYEIAAISAGWVTIEGLNNNALQGDREVAGIFERLGVLTDYTDEGAELSATPDLYSRLDVDMSDMPDAVPAVTVTAAMTGIPFRLTGVSSLRIKECDRLEALQRELLKFGIIIEFENDDTMVWDGTRRPIREIPSVETYDDHRIAMAFAPASLFMPGLVILNPGVVNKSYPGYWEDLARAGFRIVDASTPLPEMQEDK